MRSQLSNRSLRTQPKTQHWSGMETLGMKETRCSLLVPRDVKLKPWIKSLPKQKYLVYRDTTYRSAFQVDFHGCTVMQLEPSGGGQHQTMPVTMTVGGRCKFTAESYKHFETLMRTREQSQDMKTMPNGSFDWPDVKSLLLCPICNSSAPIPLEDNPESENDYWVLFYPLVQTTMIKGSQMALGIRIICRLTCIKCMESLLNGEKIKVENPGSEEESMTTLSLSALEVLEEAGSVSFLQDRPPRPQSSPDVDELLDAWTLYNLWEHSGAWEALQHDFRNSLANSMMQAESLTSDEKGLPSTLDTFPEQGEEVSSLKSRLGKKCSCETCDRIHGKKDPESGKVVRLSTRCETCKSEYYCSTRCRSIASDTHKINCSPKESQKSLYAEQRQKIDMQRDLTKVICNQCKKSLPYIEMKQCSRCRSVVYCSKDCQKEAWKFHKSYCVEKT